MSEQKEIPRWLADVVERYRAKPSPEEIRETVLMARELGFSQNELAAIFGTYQQTINRWQNHPANPPE